MNRSPIAKEHFIGLDGVAHLFAAGVSPMLTASRTALVEYCEQKSRGVQGQREILRAYWEAKSLLARYLGGSVSVDDIAFLGTAAEGMNVLAAGLDWRAGDNVVSLSDEYPTSLLPWLARRHLGVELITVDPGPDPEGAIEATVTDRTRVVCVSYVSWLTGVRLDLGRLARVVRSKGAILAVDASQALGVIPVPIEHCDVLVSCCYKFVLATQGVGIFYWNRDRVPELLQPSAGWYSIVDDWQVYPPVPPESYRIKDGAGRFEIGNPPWMNVVVLNQALRLLSTVDPARTEAWVADLAGRLRQGLVSLGLDVWTPEDPARRGPNVVFGSPDYARIVERLEQRNVLAMGSSGRVRLSLHGYNDDGDVDAALAALPAALFQ